MVSMKTSDAIALFGSVKNLAAALGLSVQAVYAWGDEVPPLRAYQIRDLLHKPQEDSQVAA